MDMLHTAIKALSYASKGEQAGIITLSVFFIVVVVGIIIKFRKVSLSEFSVASTMDAKRIEQMQGQIDSLLSRVDKMEKDIAFERSIKNHFQSRATEFLLHIKQAEWCYDLMQKSHGLMVSLLHKYRNDYDIEDHVHVSEPPPWPCPESGALEMSLNNTPVGSTEENSTG